MRQFREFEGLLKAISRVSVGVVGDFCVDAYWELDRNARELSVETGKQTVAVNQQRYSLGGAGNIVANLAALGVLRIFALGVATDDLFGGEMLRLMRGLRIHVGGLIAQSDGWQTPVYAKPYRSAVEQNRIDFGRFNRLSPKSENKLVATLRDGVSKVDAVIVNQQLPENLFTRGVIRTLNDLARKYPEKVFLLDSRHRMPDFRSMICKLNAIEAAALFGKNVAHHELVGVGQLTRYAEQFFKQCRKPVFITRGRLGILVYDGNSSVEIPALKSKGKIDSVGAGDTVAAALAAALAAGATPVHAAELAMIAAAITVRKLKQTGTASPEEIFAVARLRS
jgi:rfaE bifunctional protein kinase chain/domain